MDTDILGLKTQEAWQAQYLDGMTASEWVLWAKRLTWMLTDEKVNRVELL
jgi:hypothetical protein